jgi:hypothetical protein
MPTAAIFDSRRLQSSVKSGGARRLRRSERREGNKVHLAVDALEYLLALRMKAASEQDLIQVVESAKLVQVEAGETIEIAYVGQGNTGVSAADAVEEHGIKYVVFVILMLKNVAEALA